LLPLTQHKPTSVSGNTIKLSTYFDSFMANIFKYLLDFVSGSDYSIIQAGNKTA